MPLHAQDDRVARVQHESSNDSSTLERMKSQAWE